MQTLHRVGFWISIISGRYFHLGRKGLFFSQGAQSSHHSVRAGYSQIYSARVSDQETEGGGQVNYFHIYFVLKQKITPLNVSC